MAPSHAAPASDAEASPKDPGGTLGTFAGVFTPSILTILGLILFLRLGYVVGGAGLGQALLIIALAYVISVLTSVSLAAIATNLRVKGGGDYYLISRTLGVEYGGALGIVLFLAQSVSIAFYAIGFGEILTAVIGASRDWLPQVIAAGAVIVLFVLAWFGADVATRFQFAVMAILAAGLIAFFAGGLPKLDAEILGRNWSPSSDLPFFALFAIFFPAVTGFTQGVSMSGDLKDPARSLPRGTFLAVGCSAVVYFAVAIVLAATVPGRTLVADYTAMRQVSSLAVLVDAGVIAATLSSALASFLGAPRILQSLAKDRVFPFLTPFAKGSGPAENPRRGVLLAAVIAFVTIGIGNLNLIAPVVAMFFLVLYGLLNYATWYEARSRSPSFRPTFNYFHPHLCLLGFLACLGVMFAINAAAAALAVAILFGIFHYLKRTSAVPRWADSEHSYALERIRERLHSLSGEPEHPRDWRPVILAFSDHPDRRARTVKFASWIEGASGFTTAVRLLEGEGVAAWKRRDEVETEMRVDIARRGLPAFAQAVTALDPGESMPIVLQAHGLGAIRANTVLLNWFDHAPGPEDPPGLERYGRYLRLAIRFGCNVVILGAATEDFAAVEATPPDRRRIDVWYLDEIHGAFMLLLAYLMTRTAGWEEATIRLCAPIPEGRSGDAFAEDLRQMLEAVRIEAKPFAASAWDEETVTRESGDASVVFLPFALEGDTPKSPFRGSLHAMIGRLKVAALVRAATRIDLDAEPEEGKPGEIAAADDRAVDAAAMARKAEKEAGRAAREAERATAELDRAIVDEHEERTELLDAAAAASSTEKEAEDRRRRALKARAKAEEARREADELTGRGEPDPSQDEGEPAE